jgi:ATP-dependent Clp protease ATP-binding subunit ClpB
MKQRLLQKMNDEFVSIEHLILWLFWLKVEFAIKKTRCNRKGLKAAIDELRKGERVTYSAERHNSQTNT